MANKAVTKSSLIAYERRILIGLRFHCSVPTVHHFLCRLKILGFQYGISTELMQGYSIASCIGEYSLLSYAMLRYSPSLIAAACTYMARAICLHAHAKKDSYVTATTTTHNNNSSSSSSSSVPVHTYRPSFHEVWPYSLQAHTGYDEEQLMPCVHELQGLFLVETYARARRYAYHTLEDSCRRLDAYPDILRMPNYYEILLELLRKNKDTSMSGTVTLDGSTVATAVGSTVVSAMVGTAPCQSTRSSYESYLPSILEHMQCMVYKSSDHCQRAIITQDSCTTSTGGSSHINSSSQRSNEFSEEGRCGSSGRDHQLQFMGVSLDRGMLKKLKLYHCLSAADKKRISEERDHFLSSIIDYSITNIDHLQVHDLLIYRHRSAYSKLVTYPPI